MFNLQWIERAEKEFNALQAKAQQNFKNRQKRGKKKATKAEGLFKQIAKTISLLRSNPKHPSLQTHEFYSLEHPLSASEKVFVAYAQNKTPGAYRVFWCYGPSKRNITIIAITPHP